MLIISQALSMIRIRIFRQGNLSGGKKVSFVKIQAQRRHRKPHRIDAFHR